MNRGRIKAKVTYYRYFLVYEIGSQGLEQCPIEHK